jgi:hypothetical protein
VTAPHTVEDEAPAAAGLPPAPVRAAITAPGVYDIPAADYHRDPVPGGSLSSSGARKLLPPSCPALFRHWLDEGQAATAAMEVGSAAHLEVLGTGPELVVVDAKDWKTKAAREKAAEARARGAVPLLPHQHVKVQEMAAALRAHPLASRLLDPAHGLTEQTLVWFDREFGVWRRAMLDYLPHTDRRRRLIIPDYKTCDSAAPDDLPRSIHNYGYHQQGDWYLDGAVALGLPSEGPPAFVLIFQETNRPYLVTVVELDRETQEIGRTRNRKALDLYRTCMASGQWPGYADDVVPVGLPPWAVYQHADAEQAGAFDLTEENR